MIDEKQIHEFLLGEAERIEMALSSMGVTDARYPTLMDTYLSIAGRLETCRRAVGFRYEGPETSDEDEQSHEGVSQDSVAKESTRDTGKEEYDKLRVALRGKLAKAKTEGVNISELLTKFGATKYSDVKDDDLAKLEKALEEVTGGGK